MHQERSKEGKIWIKIGLEVCSKCAKKGSNLVRNDLEIGQILEKSGNVSTVYWQNLHMK